MFVGSRSDWAKGETSMICKEGQLGILLDRGCWEETHLLPVGRV